MTWADFYLGCFIVGFSLSLLSFLAGAVHIHMPFKMHLPFHGWNFGNWHVGRGVGVGHGSGSAPAAGGTSSSAASSGSRSGSHISWFNASTVLAFLAWFGGVGYILTVHSTMIAIGALLFALAGGLVAAWMVFRVMVKLMNEEASYMREEDYRYEGMVGTVSVSIRAGGTGEIIFEQNGVRKCAGARAADGKALERGAEVVMSRYENGIAYVERWTEFTKLPSSNAG
jgi:hypothetical protein